MYSIFPNDMYTVFALLKAQCANVFRIAFKMLLSKIALPSAHYEYENCFQRTAFMAVFNF